MTTHRPGVLRPVLDALAPWSAERVVRRVRNLAAAAAFLALLLPPVPSLGTARQEHATAIAAAFTAMAILAHLVRRRAAGEAIVSVAAFGPCAVAFLAAAALPVWTVGFGGIVVASVAASRLRRRLSPVETFLDDDSIHGFPGLVAALARSLAAVLVARTFVLLPIHVPTGSMEPTILGQTGGNGWSDHLFVDQTRWLFGAPERWDVAVFQYPLQRDVHFVKRVIGLPGETVSILDGEVWIDGVVVRKPPHVQAALWREVFPRPGPFAKPRSLGSAWWPLRDVGTWSMEGGDVVARPPTAKETTYRYTQSLRQGDLRLRCTADLAAGDASLRITSRGTLVELTVPGAGSSERPTLRVADEAPLALDVAAASGPVALELAVADGLARALVDGAEVGRVEVPLAGSERHGAEIAARRGVVRFRHLRLDRDQVWRGGAATSEWKVPADAYFVLGDNVENSMDARSWRVTELLVRGRERPFLLEEETLDETGRRLRNLRRDGDVWHFTDVEGIERAVPSADVLRRADGVPAPFVPRDHLVGRAAMIFWPWGFATSAFRPRVLP